MSEFGTKLENHISLPFLDLAFRPFFLLATLFSIFALCLWGLLLSGRLVFSPYGGGYFWHAHEMVFGFVSAVLVGFLLTAAQSWTGVRAPNGFKLFVLACVWLFARIFMLMGEIIPFEIIVSVDLSFTLLAAYFLLVMLVEKKQYRNYFAVIALLIITFLNGLTHYSLRGEPVYELRDSIHATILIITMMMTVIGGRVTPLFTANATKLPPKSRIPWLENAILLNIWVLISIYHQYILPVRLCFLVSTLFYMCSFDSNQKF
ncbi:NnrS protein involved in response to NO [Methylophaga thiooxydans]|uniref:NnrS protein involved in response to NO n=1 Tax=Methylophaga thiooxydans TaxID=392484 RepID=A0A0A0BIR8_9GAMM|nr:NnrS family protein [Methylophaga thiooxydans]KGM07582.1 NnrS protein involved in response to NO [Methylophaga thiooxydans]